MARFSLKNGIVHMDIPFEVKREFSYLLELPQGIAVEGGSARSIARRVITGEYEQVRDVDLVCVDASFNEEELDALSSEYMADDYSHGHGIQKVNVGEYFASRDFTLNEVLVVGGKVLCTPSAFRAYKLGYIEPSANEVVGSRQRAKALYLCAAIEQTAKEQNVDACFFADFEEDSDISEFDMALFLNKAMSRGRSVAGRFCQNLFYAGYISDILDPLELARDLGYEINFDFRDNSWRSEKKGTVEKYRVHSTDPLVLRELADWDEEEESVDYTPVDAFSAEEWAYANGEL